MTASGAAPAERGYGMRLLWGMHNVVRAVLFIVVTAVLYYSAAAAIPDAIKYACNLAVAAWAALEFMLCPHWKRMRFVGTLGLVFIVPFVAFWLWSCVLWIANARAMSFIERGSRNCAYMITNFLYIMGAYYLFEQKSVSFVLYGMVLANAVVFFTVAREVGVGTLLGDLFRLVVTFAEDTGPAIKKMELHEVTFGFGAFVLYYLLKKKNKFTHWFNLALCTFFFITGFKRIGIIAVALAFAAGLLYRWLDDARRKRLNLCVTLVFVVGSFLYLVAIKSRIFIDVMAEEGINTMSRDWIFYVFDEHYEITPLFMGNGIRFIWQYGVENGLWNALHNVYLELYIELGFFMYFFWMFYELQFRAQWAFRRYGTGPALYLFAGTIYIFATFLTDNSSFHLPINSLYRFLAMAWMAESLDLTDPPVQKLEVDLT